jgi:ketosteroid isomerase-like protein
MSPLQHVHLEYSRLVFKRIEEEKAMTRRHSVVLFLSFVVVLGLAACATATSPAGTEAEIIAAEEERVAAVMAGDHEALHRLTADDFIRVQPEGTVSEKEHVIAEHRTGARKWGELDVLDRKVRFVNPDVAIVHGKSSVKYEHDGVANVSTGHFTHVWVRRNGQWQMISSHYSHRSE